MRLVKSVSQEVVNVRRVKEGLRGADAMMNAVTKSHAAHIQSVRGCSQTSEESMQWIQAIKDWHNAAKYQVEEKLEGMGALDQVEGPPSKAVARTQLKRSERTLRGTNSGAITYTNRLVSQQMTQAQYHEAAPMVKNLLTRIRKEYYSIVSRLEVPILSWEQDNRRVPGVGLLEASLIRVKLVQNMPQLEQATGPRAARWRSCTSTAGGKSTEVGLPIHPRVPRLGGISRKEQAPCKLQEPPLPCGGREVGVRTWSGREARLLPD